MHVLLLLLHGLVPAMMHFSVLKVGVLGGHRCPGEHPLPLIKIVELPWGELLRSVVRHSTPRVVVV